MIADLETRKQNAALDALLRMGVQETLATTDFGVAFENFLAELPSRAAGFAARIPPGAERAIGFALFREIWNHTPRPDMEWKRLPLPKPERNAPCPCGSGRKFKQCCGELSGMSPFPSQGFSVLSYVLETIPVAKYGTLPFRRLDPEELAHVGSEWAKQGRIEAATLLLEALLAPGEKLDARHEFAFDELCNLYLDAGRDAERAALVKRLLHTEDKTFRAAVWQRQATMLADAGKHAQAWEAFKEAQRLDPDAPALAHLELVLLANQGRYDEAQTRAAFWAKRLKKQGNGSDQLIRLLEEIARDPDVLRGMMAEYANELEYGEATPADVAALEALLENLPAPSCHYRLSPQDGSAGPLEPTPALAAIENAWEALYWGESEEIDPWADTGWLNWLREHPLAWQSFIVLEDLADIFENGLFPEAADDKVDRMEEVLLDHAVALLRLVLAENGAEGLRLEWGWHENRPALRLLMQSIDLEAYTDKELPLLEWLVLTLNPNDNGGYRERLVHAYCEAGRPADALAVCDRYPGDDLPGTLYGRVLALYLLDRRGDAVAALSHAANLLPKVLKTLLAARPKKPAMSHGMVTHGGDDEAWLYRTNYRESWEKCRALDWLKEIAGKKN